MKFLTVLLLSFIAFFRCDHLLASTANDIEQHLEYFWSGDEENLYLNINLSNELEFDDNYSTMKIKNGQGCEIICKPKQAGTVFSNEGYELQEIKLTVLLKNVDNANRIAYTTIAKNSYKGTNKEGFLVSRNAESKKEGELNNPAIDLAQEPIFYTFNNDLHTGFISFKNSFPYSQIQ